MGGMNVDFRSKGERFVLRTIQKISENENIFRKWKYFQEIEIFSGNGNIFRNHGNDTEDILHLYYASISLTVSNESLLRHPIWWSPKTQCIWDISIQTECFWVISIKTECIWIISIETRIRFAQNRNSSSCNKSTCRTSGDLFQYCNLHIYQPI